MGVVVWKGYEKRWREREKEKARCEANGVFSVSLRISGVCGTLTACVCGFGLDCKPNGCMEHTHPGEWPEIGDWRWAAARGRESMGSSQARDGAGVRELEPESGQRDPAPIDHTDPYAHSKRGEQKGTGGCRRQALFGYLLGGSL